MSSPDEIYQVLMEDSRPDSFFEEYAKSFSTSQMQSWHELRSQFERYYDKMPLDADPRSVLDDPEWDLVRRQLKGSFKSSVRLQQKLRPPKSLCRNAISLSG